MRHFGGIAWLSHLLVMRHGSVDDALSALLFRMMFGTEPEDIYVLVATLMPDEGLNTSGA